MLFRTRRTRTAQEDPHQPALPDQTVQTIFRKELLSLRIPLPVPAQRRVLCRPENGIRRQIDGLDGEKPGPSIGLDSGKDF